MKYILISGRTHPLAGQYAIIDDEDYPYLSKLRWWGNRFGYVVTNGTQLGHGPKKYDNFAMHTVLLGKAPKGCQHDHENRNKLDNRRSNLRIVTRQQNQWNKSKSQNNTSGYKGVCWHKQAGKWLASIRHNNKHIYLGLWPTKEEAALAYNQAALKFFGEYAALNQII